MKALQLIVKGVVQGVGFRYFTKQKAEELGVRGHVRNLSDGSVKIYAEGNTTSIKAFLVWCHDGPPSAKVDHLEYLYCDPFNENSFEILR